MNEPTYNRREYLELIGKGMVGIGLYATLIFGCKPTQEKVPPKYDSQSSIEKMLTPEQKNLDDLAQLFAEVRDDFSISRAADKYRQVYNSFIDIRNKAHELSLSQPPNSKYLGWKIIATMYAAKVLKESNGNISDKLKLGDANKKYDLEQAIDLYNGVKEIISKRDAMDKDVPSYVYNPKTGSVSVADLKLVKKRIEETIKQKEDMRFN